MEGLVRREIEMACASLNNVAHADAVQFELNLSDTAADALITRLNEAGHGRIAWIAPDDTPTAS